MKRGAIAVLPSLRCFIAWQSDFPLFPLLQSSFYKLFGYKAQVKSKESIGNLPLMNLRCGYLNSQSEGWNPFGVCRAGILKNCSVRSPAEKKFWGVMDVTAENSVETDNKAVAIEVVRRRYRHR
ncbi:hypothetical protein AKJ16_DCAP09042 [Drosera capensis]